MMPPCIVFVAIRTIRGANCRLNYVTRENIFHSDFSPRLQTFPKRNLGIIDILSYERPDLTNYKTTILYHMLSKDLSYGLTAIQNKIADDMHRYQFPNFMQILGSQLTHATHCPSWHKTGNHSNLFDENHLIWDLAELVADP